jgi:rhamnosyltransferase
MTNQYSCPDVFAVIVTFNPTLASLDALVRQLLPQVSGALIVDNGSEVDIAAWHAQRAYQHLDLHLIGKNLGIGAAQNIGVAEARRRGARSVLLSDQDSRPAPDMVYQLRKTAQQLTQSGVRVAAVGPRYLDARRNNPPPFTRVNAWRLERLRCDSPDSVVEVDHVIASGCLIPMEAVEAVGDMREDMFIDYVDIEWGLRAQRGGYRSFGACAAGMEHSLGDTPIRFLGKPYTLHTPLRHYYRFRNAVWLYRQRHVPLQWKVVDGVRLAAKYLFYSLFARPQLAHCRMMTVGVLHGLRSRLGKFD